MIGPPTGAGGRSSGADYSVLALVAALGIAVFGYARTLHGQFQYDDVLQIVQNPLIKNLGATARALPAMLSGGRPLTLFTIALNYAAGGLEPWGWRATNLFVHLSVAVGVFALGRAVLRLAGAGRPDAVAVAGAGAFALHPLQSEAVNLVCQRAELLASAGYVATLLLLLAADRRGLGRRAAPHLAGAFAAFALGLGAKSIVVTAPFAYMALVAIVPPAGAAGLATWRRRIAVLAPFAAFAAFNAYRQIAATAGLPDAGLSIPGLGPRRYFLTQLTVLVRYLRLVVWPAGQNIDWDWPIARSAAEPAVIASAAALAVLVAGAALLVVRGRRATGPGAAAARVAAFGVAWFFVVLAPTSSVIPIVDVLVEHRLYLASWGILLAAAAGLERLAAAWPEKRSSPAALGAVAAVWLALAGALHARNAVWETRRALWTDAVAKSPRKARPYLGLSDAAYHEGRVEEAVAQDLIALDLAGRDPITRPVILYDLAAALLKLGRDAEAEPVLEAGVREYPDTPGFLTNLAFCKLHRGDVAGAQALAARATQLDPQSADSWQVLALTRWGAGRAAEGLPFIERAIALDPDFLPRRHVRALILAASGRVGEACAAWSKLSRLRFLELGDVVAAMRSHGCPGAEGGDVEP